MPGYDTVNVASKTLNLNEIKNKVKDMYGELEPRDKQILAKIVMDRGDIQTSIALKEIGELDFVDGKLERHTKGAIPISPTVVKQMKEDALAQKLVDEANRNFESVYLDLVRKSH